MNTVELSLAILFGFITGVATTLSYIKYRLEKATSKPTFDNEEKLNEISTKLNRILWLYDLIKYNFDNNKIEGK